MNMMFYVHSFLLSIVYNKDSQAPYNLFLSNKGPQTIGFKSRPLQITKSMYMKF